MASEPDYIIWHIDESEEELRAGLLHPEYFAEKVRGLKPGSRRMMEVLATRRALKVLFDGEEQRVRYDEHGRPYLDARCTMHDARCTMHNAGLNVSDDGSDNRALCIVNRASESVNRASESVNREPNHCISISHTRDYAAVIRSDVPVGIDIERREQRVQRVVSHFLKHEEVARLELEASMANAGHDGSHSASTTGDNDCDTVYALLLHLAWSAKEAAFKVLGQAYYDLMNLTTVSRVNWQDRTLTLEVEGRGLPLLIHFDYTDDYVLAWVQNEYN